jgi:hypothetical protein
MVGRRGAAYKTAIRKFCGVSFTLFLQFRKSGRIRIIKKGVRSRLVNGL